MYTLLFMAALALLVLGLVLIWLRSKAQQESQAVIESALDLTLYNQLKTNKAALPYYVDSGNNIRMKDGMS